MVAKSLTEEFPTHPLGWKILGPILQQAGKLNESLASQQKLLALSPQDAEAWNNVGVTLRALGRLEESAESYRKAIQLKPHYTEAFQNLGVTLQEMNRLEDAAASYRQAADLEPDNAEARSNLGVALQGLGKFEEAKESIEQSISLSPDNARSHYNLGNVCNQMGKLTDAQGCYERALALNPDFAEAHNNLANTFHYLNMPTEAVKSYRQAIALDANLASAHNNLGIALRKLNRLREAEDCFRKAATLKPDYIEAHSNLGSLLGQLGRPAEAEKSLKEVIALKPACADAHNNYGATLLELGRQREARLAFAKAIDLKADFAEAKLNLGLALRKAVFDEPEPWLYSPLINVLTTGNYVRPRNISRSITNLLRRDPTLQKILTESNVCSDLEAALKLIAVLHRLPLLHTLMRICPLPDWELEEIFASMRAVLLKNKKHIEVSAELIHFLSTLALHCFTNEYVYFQSDEEIQLVEDLEVQVAQTFAAAKKPNLVDVLLLACYRSLNRYAWAEDLILPDVFAEVSARLVTEPFMERGLMKGIPLLTKISDGVSLKVREQYEESPYPVGKARDPPDSINDCRTLCSA